MKEITSQQNTLVKDLKKLQQRKYRKQQKRYLLEGFHLIEEAVKYQAEIEYILLTAKVAEDLPTWLTNFPIEKMLQVTPEIMKSLTEVPAPQGILAVVTLANHSQQTLEFSKPLLLLDNVQDPGNVGTMIRTADAADFGGVILGVGTADIYQLKVLRSMQGSHFHLPVIEMDLLEILPNLQMQEYRIYGTELNPEAKTYKKVAPSQKFALIMGNEGQGVQADLLAKTDANLYIPIKGKAESLNVAVAAGILMFALQP